MSYTVALREPKKKNHCCLEQLFAYAAVGLNEQHPRESCAHRYISTAGALKPGIFKSPDNVVTCLIPESANLKTSTNLWGRSIQL